MGLFPKLTSFCSWVENRAGNPRLRLIYVLMFISLVLSVFLNSAQPLFAGPARLKMATTTSTENSGLLDCLLPPFEEEFGIEVDVIAVGTGKALKLAENGDVDIVFVHSRKAEDEFVEKGFGVNRRNVMYNDFVIVGPPADPAGIGGCAAVTALEKIFATAFPFSSRGDDSGTHKKEMELWAKTGRKPEGKWYLETGSGMGATLQLADEKLAYTLVDRGTFIAYEGKVDLVILSEGGESLFNPYGIIAVNPSRHPHAEYIRAMTLIGWVTSPQGRNLIAGHRINGKALFHPAASD